jgi:lipid A 3-O-deacylase
MRRWTKCYCTNGYEALFAVFSLALAGIPYVAHASAQDNPASKTKLESPYEDRSERSWQLEAFAAGGFVPSYTSEIPRDTFAGVHFQMQLDFLNAGFEAGRMVTTLRGPGILHGRGEVAIEILPFWLADYPKQTLTIHYTNGQAPSYFTFPALQRYGVSATPVLYRWNFINRGLGRISPWAQLGGGLLWTNHKFPVVPLTSENTSVVNFTPQVGLGANVFIKSRRSLDFAFKAVHISNASLGDNNPGLNVTLQFTAGYSWWK